MIYKNYFLPYRALLAILAISYLIFLVLVTYFQHIAIDTIDQFADQSSTLYEHPFITHTDVLELSLIIYKMRTENLVALLDSKSKISSSIDTQSQFILIDKLMKDISDHFLGNQSKVEELRVALGEWKNNIAIFRKLILLDHRIEAKNFLNDKVNPSYKVLNDKSAYILNYSNNKAYVIATNIKSSSQSINQSILNAFDILISIMTIVGGIATALLLRILNKSNLANIESQKQVNIAATSFESQEGMIVTDAETKILRVNSAFTTITGYTAEEAIGQTPRLLSSGRQDNSYYEAMWKSLTETGAWKGEILDRRKSGEIYPEYLSITAVLDAQGIVTNYVASLSDITSSKIASDEIRNLAFYDVLTHLPNRRLLIDRLKRALVVSARSGKRGALLFLDLDQFKSLNDTAGHDVGDLLLQEVATRLTNCIRESDTVSRLGGDEFLVLLEDLSQHEIEALTQTEVIGQKILNSISQPYQLDTYNHHCTASIGAILFDQHSSDVEEIIKKADIAMYQAKSGGRNALLFFDPQMQQAISSRMNMEQELRQALLQKQFELHYQIQVDGAGRSLGAEALIRWNHPRHEMISPLLFIQLAEQSGLILPIGQWVLEAACTQLILWQQHPSSKHLVLSVNVSAKQFQQEKFVTEMQEIVQRYGIDPTKLKLELTESMLVDDFANIVDKMNTLSKLGIHFSLDDFGTGYSSLQYLKKLPLSQLKIDQSFVQEININPSDFAITRTIIAMAHSLDLSVIAEGVETKEQLQCLLDIDCNQFQGYLFGKPMPIEAFDALLREG